MLRKAAKYFALRVTLAIRVQFAYDRLTKYVTQTDVPVLKLNCSPLYT